MGFYCFPDLYAALQKCSRLTFQSLTLFQKDLLGHSIEKKKVGTKFNIGSTIFFKCHPPNRNEWRKFL